jgi:Family of unknown function (DUF6402)
MPSSYVPGSAGKNPFLASPRTGGPLGTNKDAADPDTPDWFLGDTPRSTGTQAPLSLSAGDSPKPEPQAGKQYPQPADIMFARNQVFDISNIPLIMQRNGFVNGAALMSYWFSNPPKTAPDYCESDTSTIAMKWLLQFPVAKAKYDELKRRIANEATKRLVLQRIKEGGVLSSPDPNGWSTLGNLPGLTTPQMDNFYVNSITVEARYQDMAKVGLGMNIIDDFWCSLGTCQLRLAVKGRCQNLELTDQEKRANLQRKLVVYIEQSGVFAFDSYNFNDEQDLGYWNNLPIGKGSGSTVAGGMRFNVTNSDFDEYRRKNNKGGDFLVYSDIEWETLKQPVRYILQW